MFTESAELYDIVYGQFKDYGAEAGRIAELLGRLVPGARTVLDVGCGTGEHARLLAAEHGYAVDGLDIEPAFVRLAAAKNPGGRFVQGDMMSFDLGRRYDAVLCLFSSVAYVKTLENVERTLAGFRRHLAPGGVVVVEPWFEPEQWRVGSVYIHTGEAAGVKVCRMSHSTQRGSISVIEFHYLIGRESGITHTTETHELGLFTGAELEGAIEGAGLRLVEHDTAGLDGRGLYIARAPE